MKTLPVSNNMNFRGLYVNDSLCSQEQKNAINVMKNQLTDAQIADIKDRGYDVFIERTPRSNDSVSVSVMSNFDFTDECAVHTCRKIPVGDYNSNFDTNDIYNKIDKFEKCERRLNNFAKVMTGLLIATFVAAMTALAVKWSKVPKTSEVKKATTELVQPHLTAK